MKSDWPLERFFNYIYILYELPAFEKCEFTSMTSSDSIDDQFILLDFTNFYQFIKSFCKFS